MTNGDELLTAAEVAGMLRVSERTLRRWREESYGPPAFKIGRRVRYRRVEVEAWIERRDRLGGPAGE